MRKFLVLNEKGTLSTGKPKEITIVGFIESDVYPSYDEKTAFEKFGIKCPKIVEIREKCNIKLL